MESLVNSSASSRGNFTAKQFYAGMNQMKTGIAVYAPDLTLIFANKTIRNYLPALYKALDAGQSMQDGLLTQVQDIYPDIDKAAAKAQADKIYKNILNLNSNEITTPTGLRLKSHYDRTPQGGYAITTMDITDRVKHEQTLVKARHDADLANDAKTEFLANMSHEIRTPLSGVFMSAQLLSQKLRMTQQSDLSDLADILVSSASHLSSVINNVLDMSKIEAGQVDLVLSQGSLRTTLGKIAKAQDNVAREKGIKLKLVIDSNVPDAFIFDQVKVRQCVTNLINNAIKFTVKGSVTLAAMFDPSKNIMTLHIVDTGPGIAAEEQPYVFNNYAQSKRDTSKAALGTGLGLAISRNLARLMGGNLKLVSEMGKGSIFTLTFLTQPAVKPATETEEPLRAIA